jgi:hypothetical protein
MTTNLLSLIGTFLSATGTFRRPTAKCVRFECSVEVADSNIAVADRKIVIADRKVLFPDRHNRIPEMRRRGRGQQHCGNFHKSPKTARKKNNCNRNSTHSATAWTKKKTTIRERTGHSCPPLRLPRRRTGDVQVGWRHTEFLLQDGVLIVILLM